MNVHALGFAAAAAVAVAVATKQRDPGAGAGRRLEMAEARSGPCLWQEEKGSKHNPHLRPSLHHPLAAASAVSHDQVRCWCVLSPERVAGG